MQKIYNAIVVKQDESGAKYRKIPRSRLKKFVEFAEKKFDFKIIFFYEKIGKNITKSAGNYTKERGFQINN